MVSNFFCGFLVAYVRSIIHLHNHSLLELTLLTTYGLVFIALSYVWGLGSWYRCLGFDSTWLFTSGTFLSTFMITYSSAWCTHTLTACLSVCLGFLCYKSTVSAFDRDVNRKWMLRYGCTNLRKVINYTSFSCPSVFFFVCTLVCAVIYLLRLVCAKNYLH